MPGRTAEDILSLEYQTVLTAFAGSRCLLGFDFDGTLAPVARDPDQAEIRPRTRGLMAELCLLYPCVVISSRSRSNLRLRVRGLRFKGVVPAEARHQGRALERERARLRCDTAIYLGDGGADEAVFKLDQPGRLLTIRMGQKEGSCADFCLRGQGQVDRLLRRLIALRRRPGVPSTQPGSA